MKTELCTTLLVLVVISAYPLFCESQTTDTTFVKKVRGVGTLIQTIQTADGTYVSLSQTGDQKFIVRKIRTTGQKIWERTLSFPTELYYSFQAIAQISDGGYILAGQVSSCIGYYCYYYGNDSSGILVKLRSNGSLEWKKDYKRNNYSFTSVVADAGGGFVATSGFSYDGRESVLDLVKFTSQGDVVWIKSIIDSGFAPFKLVPGSGQGFQLVSGTSVFGTSGFGTSNVVNVIKLNDSGSIVWKKSLEISDFVLQTVGATSDDSLVLAGYCAEAVCNRLFLIRVKADGNVGWRAGYSLQAAPNIFSITDLLQTPDGGYAITGTTSDDEFNQNAKAFLLKVDSFRKVVFQKVFKTGQVGGGTVFPVSNGGYLLFRSMGRDVLVSSVNSNGTTPGCNLFDSATARTIPSRQPKALQPAARVASSQPLAINDIAATSRASNHPESIVCQ